jgi:hypothetical protein
VKEVCRKEYHRVRQEEVFPNNRLHLEVLKVLEVLE